uniref:SPT6 homolog, histone chaperone and transcription elongation factor n=1 Tax=Anolis carolinensis TaxID=28377 RepID=H9GNT7_ANOCA
MSDDEDDEEEDLGKEEHEKEAIAEEIFQDGEGEEGAEAAEGPVVAPDEDEEEDEDESDIDDFIVDDDGQPLKKPKWRKKLPGYTDAALQEAQDIFGVDFDYDEFEKYNEYDEEMEDEYDYEPEEAEGEIRARPKKTAKKRVSRRSIFELYEPSELESSHLTDQDNEIRVTDMPERFQLRMIPVKNAEDDELEEEADWIYRNAFAMPTISLQEGLEYLDRGQATSSFSRKGPSTIQKIKEALNFMRNQHFEVPFIAFYRKEYVEPELHISDLWRVWQWDEKWTQLKIRKQNLTRLFEKMQAYQYEQISADPDKPLADGIRALDTTDMERLKDVQSMDELKDVYNHFLLYYGRDIPRMQNAAKASRKKQKRLREDGEEEEAEGEDAEDEEQKAPELKQASRRDMYTICQAAGLDGLAKKFGLTPEQFGENLRDSYQRHETEQFPAEPLELAKDYVCSQFPTPEAVLEGACYMVALQIAREPLVRQVLRQTFQERAKINVCPTKKGKKVNTRPFRDIDEAHYAYSFKYLKNKPVKELRDDQFLKICLAKDEGLLAIDICIDMKGVEGYGSDQTYFEEIKQFYYRDEFSHQVQEWNRQRTLAIERALNQFLYPQMAKELKNKLLVEAKDFVIKACNRKLNNWLKVAPYRPDQQVEEDDDFMDENQGKGIRVLGIAFSSARDHPVFCALVNGEGEVTDFLRLPHFTKRRNAWREDDREKKAQDIETLKKFLLSKKPHVVTIAGENRDAQMLMEDVKRIAHELEQGQQLSSIGVELVDNELATLYMNSKKSENVALCESCSFTHCVLCSCCPSAAYIKRVIAHPSFHNINFKQAEKMMESMDQGDVIIRPSSKGENHLTVTWKVCEGVSQHVDVREEGKENAFSLGATLWINTEEFEDLDEIVARYVQPMASFARDLLSHKYYQDCHGGDRKKLEELLIKTKKEKPTFIPYFVCACRDLPGKFLLGYQPRGKPRIEYVTVTPEGFRYRNHIFPTVNGLFRWFKDHYQDPVPGKDPLNMVRSHSCKEKSLLTISKHVKRTIRTHLCIHTIKPCKDTKHPDLRKSPWPHIMLSYGFIRKKWVPKDLN